MAALKKKDDGAVPGWDMEALRLSVLTGRTQEEIAQDLPARPRPGLRRERPMRAGGSQGRSPRTGRRASRPCPASSRRWARRWPLPCPRTSNGSAELKWDGVRALCLVDDGKLEIYTRNGNRCERQYPELSVLPHHVKAKQAILDGEIAVLDEKGVPSFAMIQPRIMAADAAAIAHMTRTAARAAVPLRSALSRRVGSARRAPARTARKLLEKLVKRADPVRISDTLPAQAELFEAARQNGLEGLVAKCLTSTYESRRSRNWLKMKLLNSAGVRDLRLHQLASAIISARWCWAITKRQVPWAGNVGTGFDQKLLAAHPRDDGRARNQDAYACRADPKFPKDIVWVKPDLVCEVKFSNWTPDKHLRAPVFLGLRQDVNPNERAGRTGDRQHDGRRPKRKPRGGKRRRPRSDATRTQALLPGTE